MMKINLYNDDCINAMTNNIEEKSIDMVLCDLPYGITAQNEWDKPIPFEPMWKCIHKVTNKNTPILLFSQMPFGSDLIQSNKKEFRYEWIWQKTNPLGFLNANRMPLRTHENILVFYKALPKYNPQFWESNTIGHRGGTGRLTSNYSDFKLLPNMRTSYKRYPLDIIRFSNADRTNQLHPTQKPVDLLEYLIRTYTDENETVLDFCMGSGSTGVACVNTNRNFIGVEINEEYYKIAKKRIEKENKVGVDK